MINLRKYAVVFVLTVVGLTLAGFGLGFLGITLPVSLNTWLPPAVAALIVGQDLARETRAPLPASDYWRLGLIATLVAVALHVIIATLIFTGLALMVGVNILAQLALLGPMGIAVIALMMIFAINFSNVAFLWIGVRNELRAQSKRAGGK